MTVPPLREKGGNLYLIEPKARAQVSPGQPLLPAPWGSWPGAISRGGSGVRLLSRKTGQDLQKLQDGDRAPTKP